MKYQIKIWNIDSQNKYFIFLDSNRKPQVSPNQYYSGQYIFSLLEARKTIYFDKLQYPTANYNIINI